MRVEDGKQIDEPRRRPKEWSELRLVHLFQAVQAEKKKSGLTKDLDALKLLARQRQWRPPTTHRSRSSRGEYDAWVRTLQSRLHDAKQLKRKVDRLNALMDGPARDWQIIQEIMGGFWRLFTGSSSDGHRPAQWRPRSSRRSVSWETPSSSLVCSSVRTAQSGKPQAPVAIFDTLTFCAGWCAIWHENGSALQHLKPDREVRHRRRSVVSGRCFHER